jgi:hypothetical protein
MVSGYGEADGPLRAAAGQGHPAHLCRITGYPPVALSPHPLIRSGALSDVSVFPCAYETRP